MNYKNPLLMFLLCIGSIFILAACSNSSTSSNDAKEREKEDQYEKLAEEKNAEIELTPIELTSYAKEVGFTLNEPVYQEFAVNGEVLVQGEIKNDSELKSDYAWIKVYSNEEGPAGDTHEYYVPIKEGKIERTIHFFNGEGEYRVKVQLPSKDRENYYYDSVEFQVVNVNPETQRDVAYTPFGYEAGLSLNLDNSYAVGNEVFQLKGKTKTLTDDDTMMITLKKDSESWKHIIPIKSGEFSYDVPLFYGEGLHELEILVPDKERENYYQVATTILIDNESTRQMKPIEFSNMYMERGVTLKEPLYGGGKTGNQFTIKGSIDPDTEYAAETTHIYITTKKGEDEALDVIPVKDYKFDDSFYLRFGPGTYEVMVSVPEIKEENRNYFRYFGFAQFEIESTSTEDKRDLLPSRGVQSDDPRMIQLAQEITAGKATEREKAKAIYDYVAENISYDVQKFENDEFSWDDSALKALELKTGVCQDYAFLATALLRASDIEARFVEGKAGSGMLSRGILGGRHAWVEANIDGEWLTMDPTWGAGYVKDGVFVAKYNEQYFDPNMEEFNKTHYRIGVVY